MHIDNTQYAQAYNHILSRKHKDVYIICAASDVDSLCSCTILSWLFKQDYVKHKIIPLDSYTKLSQLNEELLANNDTIGTIIMINCGGCIDLSEYLSLHPSVVVFVVDSNRPLNLDNLFNNDQVCVFDDGDVEDLEDERQAYMKLIQEGEEDDEEVSGTDSEDDDEDDDASDMEGEEDKENRRASRKKSKATVNYRQLEKIIDEYYSLSYCGSSSAGLIYQLASQRGKASNNLLWLSIIGCVYQYIYHKASIEQYLIQVDSLKEEVMRFNDVASGVSDASSLSPDDERVVYKENELQLMLFRHWSLQDSLMHSSYVAARLGLWRERGRQKLKGLLAKMGFSLTEATQPYVHMDLSLRKVMYERLRDYAAEYGLQSLFFPSFQKHFGFKCVVGASDTVYALTALMEYPSIETIFSEFDAHEKDGFFLAMDAFQNVELLKKGIQLAQTIQRTIVRVGTSIIDERSVKTLKSFRLVVLNTTSSLTGNTTQAKAGPNFNTISSMEETTMKTSEILLNPLTLTKLAYFLTDAMKEAGKVDLPFVCAVLDKHKETYMVVGVDCADREGSVRQNQFGKAFNETADATRARVRQDRFDTSVVEIAKPDLTKFMEHLQLVCQK